MEVAQWTKCLVRNEVFATYQILQLSLMIIYSTVQYVRWDSAVGIATRYGAGRSGDRIPVGGEIFHTWPDQPWEPPSLFLGGKRPWRGTHVHLGPRLKKE